jgi:hypothetical protein
MGFVRNMDEYLAGISKAWEKGAGADTVYVEQLDAVFDYKAWLEPHVYDTNIAQCREDTNAQAAYSPYNSLPTLRASLTSTLTNPHPSDLYPLLPTSTHPSCADDRYHNSSILPYQEAP